MKRAIICGLIVITIVSIADEVIRKQEDLTKEKIYHEEATVVSLGQCQGSACSITLKDRKTAEVKYITSYEPLSVGQTMYKMCWYSKAEGHMCYVDYSTSKKTN